MNMLSAKRTYLVGILALALGIVFNILFFQKPVGISFVIYAILLVSSVFILLSVFKIPYPKSSLWFVPAIIFFSSIAAVRDNDFLQFFNSAVAIALLLLLAHQLTGQAIKQYLFVDYVKTAVVLPFMMLGKSFNALGRILSVGKRAKESNKRSQITKGILITLPIFLFFLALLSSADVIFKHFVTNAFNFDFDIQEEMVGQIWWAVFFALIWLGAYTYILEHASKEETPVSPVVRRYGLGNIEAGILFTTLNVLFLTFVSVQIKYFFAGHDAVTKLGYTYAEYAHKGFGELVFVALFTFALIFLAERYVERSDANKPTVVFKSLTGVLMALVLVIMVSAFTRLHVYEEAYGFTMERVLVQAFIIWLAAVFLWLGYKTIKDIDDRKFVFGLFVSVTAFFAAFTVFNPDAFVAKKNIDQFAKTGKLDTLYLSTLSGDAIPAFIPLLEVETADTRGNRISNEVAEILQNYHGAVSQRSWQSYNVSRSRAVEVINSKRELISTLTSLSQTDTISSHPTQE